MSKLEDLCIIKRYVIAAIIFTTSKYEFDVKYLNVVNDNFGSIELPYMVTGYNLEYKLDEYNLSKLLIFSFVFQFDFYVGL